MQAKLPRAHDSHSEALTKGRIGSEAHIFLFGATRLAQAGCKSATVLAALLTKEVASVCRPANPTHFGPWM